MQNVSSFDVDVAREYVRVRQSFTKEVLEVVRKQVALESALDVGCGVGYFSKFLSELGFRVVALDGREEHIAEAKQRHPAVSFLARDVEDQTLPQLGTFDFVLCYGLLYHLENPFLAIRNLHALTGKLLMIETMCVPGADPNFELLDEYHSENQGLKYVALYPTESVVLKMLYRAGFPFVYRFRRLRLDGQFETTLWRKKSRTILAASKIELRAPNMVLAQEPIRMVTGRWDPWTTTPWKIRDYCWNRRVGKMFRWIKKRWRGVSQLPADGKAERESAGHN